MAPALIHEHAGQHLGHEARIHKLGAVEGAGSGAGWIVTHTREAEMGGRDERQCVGVDVSAKTLHVAVDGVSDVLSFANTLGGHKALAKRLTKAGRSARVVIEATGHYHFDLACHLADTPRVEVMVANPRDTNHFHHAQGVRAKTDTVDARTLAQFARRMPFVAWRKPAEAVIELRASTRYLDQLVDERVRLLNQRHAAAASTSTPAWVSQELTRRLEELKRTIAFAEAQVLAIAERDPDLARAVALLSSMPGIGEPTAVRLVAELAPLSRDMTSKHISAWAGLDPRPRESGTSVRGRRGISKRGSSRVRRILYMPALNAYRSNPVLGDLYERVTGRSGSKLVGLVAVMRKMLVISWAMLKSDTAWTPVLAGAKLTREATQA